MGPMPPVPDQESSRCRCWVSEIVRSPPARGDMGSTMARRICWTSDSGCPGIFDHV